MTCPHEDNRNGGVDLNNDKEQMTNLVSNSYEYPYATNAEWILVAAMIDRLSLLVYVVVCSITMGLCLA